MPMIGQATDEGVIAEALPRIECSVMALENLADASGPYLCGPAPSLADRQVAPVMAYFSGTPEGLSLRAKSPRLSRWWQVMRAPGREKHGQDPAEPGAPWANRSRAGRSSAAA